MKQVRKKKQHHRHIPLQKRAFHGYDNTKDLFLILNAEKSFQDVLGMTSETLTKLFETAIQFLQQGRLDEAKEGIELLLRMNPYVADFWIAIAVCNQKFGRFNEALTSFLMAQSLDPVRSDVYLEAIALCFEMKNYTLAKALIYQGKKNSSQMDEEEKSYFLKELKSLEREIE